MIACITSYSQRSFTFVKMCLSLDKSLSCRQWTLPSETYRESRRGLFCSRGRNQAPGNRRYLSSRTEQSNLSGLWSYPYESSMGPEQPSLVGLQSELQGQSGPSSCIPAFFTPTHILCCQLIAHPNIYLTAITMKWFYTLERNESLFMKYIWNNSYLYFESLFICAVPPSLKITEELIYTSDKFKKTKELFCIVLGKSIKRYLN